MDNIIRISLILLILLFLCRYGNGQRLDSLRGPWRLVYKVHKEDYMIGYTNAVEFYERSGGSSETDVNVMRDMYGTGTRYRSTKLDTWGTTTIITAVRLAMWVTNTEKAYFVFNALGKTKSNWMDCDNLIDSSYTDVSSQPIATCTISNSGRNFLIQSGYGGCTNDNGWFMLKDSDAPNSCDWDGTGSYVILIYAASVTKTTWNSAKQYADAMTISVQEWYMVFKGIEGVTPTDGSLQQSWEGSNAENDGVSAARTVTTSPSSHYKNRLSEIWTEDFTIIEQVLYGFFYNGDLRAYVIFNGIGSTKTSFFQESRIIESSYSDITTSSPDYCSISGDGYRHWVVVDAHGGCLGDRMWMLVMDNHQTNKACGFDQDLTNRPYFLYSSGSTSVQPDSSASTWNSNGFPMANVMGLFVKGWFPVLKVANGQSTSPASSSIYYLLESGSSTYDINEYDPDAYSFNSGTKSYRSRIVSGWTSYYISAVRISIIKSGTEVEFFVFDGHGSSRTDWMSCTNRLLYSSYTDLTRSTSHIFCSVDGANINRRFFIESSYGGCGADNGWLVSVEGGTCSWETSRTRPYVLYSDAGTTKETNDNMNYADVFVISVAFEDLCNLNPCSNGATCYERGVRFECECDGDYYGLICTDLDGGWSAWSAWSLCSITCHYDGTKSRSRSCNNPTTAGSGVTCTGSVSDSTSCTAPLEVCPLYSSGTKWNGASYNMVCPVNFTIYTQTAWYGRDNSGSCYDTASQTRLATYCDGKETCNVVFSSSIFAGYNSDNCWNCPLSNNCTTTSQSGYATFMCGRDGGVSPWQPWSLCTKTCDTGARTRARTCDNPLPISPGTTCVDPLTDTKDCFTNACPTCGEHASGYRNFEPANMTSYNDSSMGVGFLLTNTWWEIICCESLEAIEFMPLHEGSITFIVWRSSGSSYSVVITSSYVVTSAEVGLGTAVNYTFTLGTRMITKTGDMLGWYTSGPNMIPFITCTGEEACPNATKKASFASEPTLGNSFAWGTNPGVEVFTDRAYAVKFYTNENTAPYVNQTDFTAFVKDHEPIGTHAVDYAIFTDETGDPLVHSINHAEDYFELNSTYDPIRLFLQVKRKLPKSYNIYTIRMTSTDTCSLSVTTTYEITTYNAPPVYLNLPTAMEIKEDVAEAKLIWEIDVMDPSDNDSICCTLAKVEPASFNFELKLIDQGFKVYLTEHVVFNYKEISDFYKLRICCSDETGASMTFIDIDIIDVIIKEPYIPPAWFFMAIICSLIPIMVTFLIACFVLFSTMFCTPELRYVIVYED